MNRYDGNTGRMVRLPDGPEPGHRELPAEPRPVPVHPVPKPRPQIFPVLDNFSRLLPEKAGELETEDVILLLILYLMYRESGDSELLMIMGAMFLL